MADRRILYFTADRHSVFRARSGKLEQEASFAADDAGAAEFRNFLASRKNSLFTVLADLVGEDFHPESIPYLRGSDRQNVLDRRLAQRYRDTRLATALSLGTVAGERRNERVLLASFTNTQQFTPWLDALNEAGVRLAGVFSVPLLAPRLAARLGGRGKNCFVVTVNRSGLRQSFVENGRLRFARLEHTVDMSPEALALFVRSETYRLAQYLGTLRAMPRDGGPVQVIVVAPPGHLAVFEQALVSDPRLTFRSVDLAAAAKAIGLKQVAPDLSAEQLYLHVAATHPPKEQFARTEDRRSFRIWQMQRWTLRAGALGFAACLGMAGLQWFEVASLRDQAEFQQRDGQIAQREYERITAQFPVTHTTSDNLKATVNEFLALAGRSAYPEPALVYVSKALEQFPQIELDTLDWRVGKAESLSKGTAKPAAAPPPSAPAGAAPQIADLSQIIILGGRVNATQRSDYRGITAQVQRFAEALRADRAWQIVKTQLPFDVTSDGTLSGDIGQVESGDLPRFEISIARRLGT
ncbi:MAG: hypothetical protein HY017_17190 [Betaproteobacteria bacterium]|nr:hypothetical protein [Betaproteobacteria bacterium]